jgi:REP element-mobilizing transposase RayT
VDRRPVFIDDVDRRRLLALIIKASRDGRARCLDYCLMGNHFHLALQALDEPFGDVMRDVLAAYVRVFNERHGRDGHLFEQRYGAKPVRTERHLFALVRYLAYNPVAAGLCASPSAWPWSGYGELSGITRASVTAADDTLRHLGETVEAGRRAYRTLIADATERHVALACITCAQEPESRRAAILAAHDAGCSADDLAAAASWHPKSIHRLLRERNKSL